MADTKEEATSDQAEKDAKREKHRKRMNKILYKAWNLPDSTPFQEAANPSDDEPRDLTVLGQNLDKGVYAHGKSGWEVFADDMGKVYNWHIIRRSKGISLPQNIVRFDYGEGGLAECANFRTEPIYCVDVWAQNPVLGKKAANAKPSENASNSAPKKNASGGKKRKNDGKDSSDSSPKKKATGSNGSLSLSQREKRAMELLSSFLEECGAGPPLTVVQRPGGRFDTAFFSAENKRFKSMTDVARFLNLAKAPKKGLANISKKGRGSKDVQERRLKRELEKLKKSKLKATKALEDHDNNVNPTDQLLVDQESFWDDGSNAAKSHKEGRVLPRANIECFPGIPTYCIPDLLLVSAKDRNSQTVGELDLNPPSFIPVYLSECHIALLRLLIKDATSDLWWWSILETPEMVEQEDEYLVDRKRRPVTAVVKIDMESLLAVDEDPLVTTKWLQALEDVRTRKPDSSGPIKSAVKNAIAVTTNQHVKSYLKKAMRSWKAKSAGVVKRAVVWLIDRMKEARPDLWGRKVSTDEIAQQKKLVADEAALEMENIIEEVNDDNDGDMNLEEDSDDESDSDDDDGSDNEDEFADQSQQPPSPGKLRSSVAVKENDETTPVTTFVPVKPVPSVVDLLLPPGKPVLPTDLVSALSWPSVIGATSCRVFQWYKRRRNEVDDSIREFRELKPMSVAERRRREECASSRILSECGDITDPGYNHIESAIKHLCDGNDYLDLTAVQRLGILRMLIETAYDTHHIQLSIEDNFKARVNAVKALDAEERRAKKTAKEELAAMESAARERLAAEGRDAFIATKREELIEDIKASQEYSVEFIESLNDEDIIDLDDDTKAEYEALPTADSFNKAEVNAVVKKIQEETAFGAESLTVLTLDDIEKRDEEYLKSLQDELLSFGDIDTMNRGHSRAERETFYKVDRLRREITNFTEQMQSLSEERKQAIEDLKDAIEDGTVKTLRAAMRTAKLARLSGDDEKTNGVWALDLIRDAALELKNAESRKRVTEAQKDLIAKRDKCFIRTEPLGRDRYQSCFFHFDYDQSSRIWTERDLILKSKCNVENANGILLKHSDEACIGAEDKSGDFLSVDDRDQPTAKSFLDFCRQEYHHSAQLSTLARHHWSCYTTDSSLRVLVKNLDGKCATEKALKEVLKETLEAMALASGGDANPQNGQSENNETVKSNTSVDFKSGGDENVFLAEKANLSEDGDIFKTITSAIGHRVRLRSVPNPDRAPDVAEYTMGTVTGWKIAEIRGEEDAMDIEGEASPQNATAPLWRIEVDNGGELHLSGKDIVRGIARAVKWENQHPGYVEYDAPFLSYRNGFGRFCGRAAEAPSSTSAQAFAKHMIKKENDLYNPLKNRTYENNWGGKAGTRAAWTSSLREHGHSFEAVRDGLLTFENAVFELTGGFTADEEKKEEEVSNQGNPNSLTGKDLLYDETSRFDIELESLGRDVKGLWNSYDTRQIFREIIASSKTVSILALGLDLVCRNAQAYIDRTKSSAVEPVSLDTSGFYGRRRAAVKPGGYSDFF
eukprot:scaffold14081_cov138-Skeletonema_menzelii.AAC.3